MGKPNFSGGLRYKRWPGSYGGKPSLAVDNTLDRQFDVAVVSRIFRTFDDARRAPIRAKVLSAETVLR